MAWMTQRQYAKHKGVARSAVQRAIRDGRIDTRPDGMIDAREADRLWEERTINPVGDGSAAVEFMRARAIREHYQARLAKLEYEQKIGSLVSRG